MRIAAINTNQQNNKQSFGANFELGRSLTDDLKKVLPPGRTNDFLNELDKTKNMLKIKRIHFIDKGVDIKNVKVEPGCLIDVKQSPYFVVEASISDMETGSAKVLLKNIFGRYYSGKALTRKFIKGIKSAVENIKNDSTYLNTKARNVERAIASVSEDEKPARRSPKSAAQELLGAVAKSKD